MEHDLLHGMQKSWPWQQGEECFNTDCNPSAGVQGYLRSLMSVHPNFTTMLPVLYVAFPQELTSVYLIRNPKAYRVLMVTECAAFASALLIAALASNVVTYIMYLTSASQEHTKADIAFKQIGFPLIILQYIMLCMALMSMSYAGSYVLSYNTPFAQQQQPINFVYYSLVAYCPPLFLFLPLSFLAYKRSGWAIKKDVSSKVNIDQSKGGT